MQEYHGWGLSAIWARTKPPPRHTRGESPKLLSTAPWDSQGNTEATPAQKGGYFCV